MIFLEQTVNQILREEGQLIVTLADLNITWEMLQDVFIGTFEQAKQYMNIYDWESKTLSTTPTKIEDYSHIKHLTYNVYGMQRFLPDIPGQFWEFNPYTKNASSLFNTTLSVEAGKYPTLDYLSYSTTLKVTQDKKKSFILPCNFDIDTFSYNDMEAYEDNKDENKIILQGDSAVGKFDTQTLQGYIISDTTYSGTLSFTTKYVGIEELDLTCELFYIWFKSHVMNLMGAMKKQIDLQGVGLPFDINADSLLERGRQLLDYVETLKGTKSHWSNF